MLYLNGDDIERAVDKPALIDNMAEAMKLAETNRVIMPPRTYVNFGLNSLALMPCIGVEGFSTKLVTIFPGNEGGPQPVVNGLVVLNDIATGAPRALFNGRKLTALRTGAVGAAGVRTLAVDRPQALGLVGAGVQGFEQVRFAAAIRRLTSVQVYDRDPGRVEDMVARLTEELPEVEIGAAKTVEGLLEVCDTVITATTSRNPVLPDSAELFQGKCLIAIGSFQPEMRELPRAAFEAAGRLFIDTPHARHESGDVISPLAEKWLPPDRVRTLGGLLNSGGNVSTSAGATSIFKSVGMALFDLMAAEYIFRSAEEMGLGQRLDP